MAAHSILVVDDDIDIREMLRDYLESNGFEVLEADCADAVRRHLDARVPHLALLDVGLPGEDGLSLARFLRERHNIGIIMVSGAGETVDRIIGLEVGADDYVSKPFDLRELLARMKSVLRRYAGGASDRAAEPAAEPSPEEGDRIAFGHCVLDPASRRLFDQHGVEVPVTRMEFDLLQVFAERPNRVLSRDQILNLTQNRDWDPYDRSIDIRIARLRRKVEADPDNPRTLRTVRGSGYMFVPDGD